MEIHHEVHHEVHPEVYTTRSNRAKLLKFSKYINLEILLLNKFKYILFTDNSQKLDREIFLESVNFCDFNIHVDSSVK